MGRKRAFERGDSSDDDFQPSGDERDRSPVVSRLKRKRRSSARNRSQSVCPSVEGSESRDGEDSDVICIPESLDEEDKGVPETPLRKPKSPSPEPVTTPKVVEQSPVHDVDEDSRPESAQSVEEGPIEVERRPRRQVSMDRSSFDESSSESEASQGDDDDDAYNSKDDEPDDDDEESDFEPSPKKASRKKELSQPRVRKTAAMPKGKPSPGNAKTEIKPSPRKPATTRKTIAVRESAKKSPSLGTPASGKKRLGARIPSKLSSILKPNTSQAARQTSGAHSRIGSTVFRAGLSRNAAIPRLHSYLQR